MIACRGQCPQPIILEMSERVSISRGTTDSSSPPTELKRSNSCTTSYLADLPNCTALRDLRGKSGAGDSAGSVCGRHTRVARRNRAAGCRRSYTHIHTYTHTYVHGHIHGWTVCLLPFTGPTASGSSLPLFLFFFLPFSLGARGASLGGIERAQLAGRDEGVADRNFARSDTDRCHVVLTTTGFTTWIRLARYAPLRLLRYDSTIARVFFVLAAVGPRACVAAETRRLYACAWSRVCVRTRA